MEAPGGGGRGDAGRENGWPARSGRRAAAPRGLTLGRELGEVGNETRESESEGGKEDFFAKKLQRAGFSAKAFKWDRMGWDGTGRGLLPRKFCGVVFAHGIEMR